MKQMKGDLEEIIQKNQNIGWTKLNNLKSGTVILLPHLNLGPKNKIQGRKLQSQEVWAQDKQKQLCLDLASSKIRQNRKVRYGIITN